MFIVEMVTRTGKVCESHATCAEARRRVEQFPPTPSSACP